MCVLFLIEGIGRPFLCRSHIITLKIEATNQTPKLPHAIFPNLLHGTSVLSQHLVSMNRTPEQNQFRVVLDHYSEYSDVWARMRFALCAFFGIVSQKMSKGVTERFKS